ncbi:hypothetical protein M433DRAFT_71759 [Acidomyces richmondensis BFW]|nr:hypothetical protein M433DRAFT_71759 [Acidomyces richmondensis BFW]
MKSSRYSSSRQKSCNQCSIAKARCDRKSEGCSRCLQRGSVCTYICRSHASPGAATCISSNDAEPCALSDTVEFTELDLVCTLNVEDISNRWLNRYIPLREQPVKKYPAGVSSFISRMLKAYAATVVHGRGMPPFVHPVQLASQSSRTVISTCASLARVCEMPFPGSEHAAYGILQREMNSLYEHRESCTEMDLLATFQSYLLYSMILFFWFDQGVNDFLRQAMIHLQQLACATSRHGLVCRAESQGTRPKWEAWIAAEAKRRTLFTMYMFDSILSAHDGLPSCLATELEGLPAPASKDLWQAHSRRGWHAAYNAHLAEWPEGDLRIDELWPTPSNLNDGGVISRRKRTDLWLEKLDEFGTMLYAVTSCTHGG